MELDKIIVKYAADITELKNDLNDVKKQTVGFEKQAADSSKKVEDSLNKVGDNVSGKLSSAFSALGKVVAAAFAVERIGAFINSSIELATRTQEIKAEFDKLNNPALLSNLKKATDGTVSNLKLMEIALRADKLGVPMDKLGKIMEYAKFQADGLGKSTEELVDIMVQGIGIKSTRALKDVGIGVDDFNKEVQKTGDYFTALDSIMTTTLANAGEGFVSVADKQDMLRASIENTKVEIGNRLLPVIDDLLSGLLDVASAFDRVFNPKGTRVDAIYQSIADSGLGVDGLTTQLERNKAEIDDILKRYPNIENINRQMLALMSKGATSERDRIDSLRLQNAAIEDYVKSLKTVETQEDKVIEVVEKQTTVVKEQVVEVDALMEGWKRFGMAMATIDPEFEKYIADLTRLNNIAGATGGKMRDAATGVEELDEELATSTASWEDYGNALLSIFDSINTAYSQGSDYRLGVLQKELEAGTISEEEYDKKRKEILRAEASREKAFSILSISLSTARAIMAALGSVPPNPALAVLAGVTGAIQLGVAAAAPIPAFEMGGKVKGGEQLVRINEKGEEYVIRAEMTRKHQPLLEAINKDKFNEYIQKTTIKETKGNDVISWDDYRLLLELRKGNYTSRENTQRIVEAIKSQRQPHRFL